MKPIQVMFDEGLLRRLDADQDVKKLGRSAVLRRAVDEYLKRRRSRQTAEAYRRAYAGRPGLGDEFSGWDTEGTWPEK